jgi:hypothetical protein
MKYFLFSLWALSASPLFASSLCSSPDLLASAERQLTQAQELFRVGEATRFEIHLAEQNVLQVKLCMDPSDVQSFAALATNAIARQDLVEHEVSAGRAEAFQLVIIGAERTALMTGCRALQQKIEGSFRLGEVSMVEVDLIRGTCQALAQP